MYAWRKYEIQITRVQVDDSEPIQIEKPNDVVQLFSEHAKERDQESFWIVALNQKNQCIGIQELYRGTADGAMVKIGEALRLAILLQAPAFVIVHNHPSGSLEPSEQDIALTASVYESSVQLEIDFLDHVIVTSQDALSIRSHLAKEQNTVWDNKKHMIEAEEMIRATSLLS